MNHTEKGETMYCRNCGTKLDEDCKFCTNCGARVTDGLVPVAEAERTADAPQHDVPSHEAVEPADGSNADIPENPEETSISMREIIGTPAGKNPKRRMCLPARLGAAAIALISLVLIITVVAEKTLGKTPVAPNTLVYSSDDALFLLKDYSSDTVPIHLGDEGVSDDYPTALFSNDGKWVYYYLPGADTSTGMGQLCRTEADPEKNETSMTVVDFFDASFDIYSDPTLLKNGSILYKNEQELCFFDGETTKRFGPCRCYRLSEDETYIVFLNEDMELYYQLLADGNSRMMIDSNVYSVYYTGKDTFLYTKQEQEGSVYRVTIGGVKEKLLENISDIVAPRSSDTRISDIPALSSDKCFYFIKGWDCRTIPMYDLVNDTRLQQDQSANWAGKDLDEYRQREELRNSLRSEMIGLVEYELYLFDDGEISLICDSVVGDYMSSTPKIWTNIEKKIAFYNTTDQLYRKIDIDEISSAGDLFWYSNQVPGILYYTIGTNTKQLMEIPHCVDVNIKPLGQEIVLNFKLGYYGNELVSYQIENGTLSNRNIIADDCYINRYHWTDSGELYYYLDYSTDSDLADLYRYSSEKGAELVAEDVSFIFNECFQNEDSVYFIRNNSLEVLKNGKSAHIADNVDAFCCTESNQCIYRVGSELFLYGRKGSRLLARNVKNFWCAGSIDPI